MFRGRETDRKMFNLRCDRCTNKFYGYLANEEEVRQIEESCLSCKMFTGLVCGACGFALGVYFYLS